MFIRGILLAALLSATFLSYAGAQSNAPGALDTYSHCAHNTCLWLPFSGPSTFQRGPYEYLVDTEGAEATGDFILRAKGTNIFRTELKELSGSVSVVWAPDSTAFAITWSDGGAIGGFHVRVFSIHDGIVKELPATKRAFTEFEARHYCKERGDNIQAYRWTNDSRNLVLVLSVYPTGDCGPDLGHLEAYIVRAADGAILKHMTLKQFLQYRRLHPELQ